MAKTKTNPRPKSSTSYLCCFGISSSSSSVSDRTPIEESNIIIGSDYEHKNHLKQKMSNNRWFRFRVIPLDQSSESEEKEKVKLKLKSKGGNKVDQNHSSKFRSKSNNNIHNKTPPSPPTQKTPLLVLHHLSPTHSQTSHQNSKNNNVINDTCQKSSSSSTILAASAAHAVSVPTSKRQMQRRLLSSLQPKTTQKQQQNANKPYNGVVGVSIVMVTLVIMILWGRFCAIVCTSMCLYFVPHFRLTDGENDVVENDCINDSKDLDLDSVVYKKRVVLEGLLERNHSDLL